MGNHRKDLIERVHHILGELDQGPAYPKLQWPDYNKVFGEQGPYYWDDLTRRAMESYKRLERVLLEVDAGQ